MDKYLILHYGELALKGGNKEHFQKTLRNDLIRKLRLIDVKSGVDLVLSRFVVKMPADYDENQIYEMMMNVPGIENFGFYYRCELDFDKICEVLKETWSASLVAERGFKTFCVRVKKSQENLPFDRLESEKKFGACLLKNDIGLKVKMDDADIVVNVEIFGEKAYVCYEKFKGLGGLPAGTGGNVLALISKGFDSPVAAFRMMKRGAKVHFIHFSGQPYTKREETEHVKDLVKILARFQSDTKLFIIPFGEIQKKISLNLKVPAGLRILIYRRLMFRIAERMARYIGAKALVTGESFAQVASQTLNNLVAVDESTNMLVLRPLIGNNKVDIVNESKKIGTHDISALPCTDTCSLFSPKSPELSAKIEDVLKAEENIDIQELCDDAFKGREKIAFE